jgi:Fe-S-cluster containining protein
MAAMKEEAKAADGVAQADLAALCQSCGLCCDGSLFGRVGLEPEEVELARRRRLRVLPRAEGFEQPCAALASPGPRLGERRCSIYDDRPLACRRFVCRLLDRHRREGGAIEGRLSVVRRVRSLVASLEASGLTPADFEGTHASTQHVRPGAEVERHAYLELTRILEEDFARAR